MNLLSTIAALDEMEGKSTPKPWTFSPPDHTDDQWSIQHPQYVRGMGIPALLITNDEDWGTILEEDSARFVAAVRNAYPALSAAIRAAAEWLRLEDEDWESLPSERVTVARMAFRRALEGTP